MADDTTIADDTATAILLTVNGTRHSLTLDNRTTLLDALREHAGLTGAKKGCDHGQCGACTVLADGRRVNSCLLFAVAVQGSEITTIEGLGTVDELHPLQRSFISHDGLQCGYCTPGQICSAAGMLAEAADGWPSVVSADLAATDIVLDDRQIRERMSGNLCRCGAYPGIVAAIRDVAGSGAVDAVAGSGAGDVAGSGAGDVAGSGAVESAADSEVAR